MSLGYGKITIWCYKCGHLWFNLDVTDLYAAFSRCPNVINRGGTLVERCDGYTDGIEAKGK